MSYFIGEYIKKKHNFIIKCYLSRCRHTEMKFKKMYPKTTLNEINLLEFYKIIKNSSKLHRSNFLKSKLKVYV